jgi:hypothetical protein
VIRRAAILIVLPILVLGAIAIPLGLFYGSYQWMYFGVVIGVTVPPGFITLLAAEWLEKRLQFGRVIALFVGTFVRLVIGFGGGLLFFLASDTTLRSDPLSFLFWLMGAYLVTLSVETVLLARQKDM